MKWLALLLVTAPVLAADLSALIADREAVERVYYNHRTGEKPPFEKTLTPEQLRELVGRDLAKEAVLKKRYGIEISDAQVAAEVARINATTRAPETLVEIKAALGDDQNRFARAVARPLVVERLLRVRFQDDEALHTAPRRKAESLRTALLEARHGTNGVPRQIQLLRTSGAGDFSETTWRLDHRATNGHPASEQRDASGKFRERSFDELSSELQKVLRAQLNGPGDVTAVIETPDSFLLFVAERKSETALASASINIPKCDYEAWVDAQAAARP